MERILALDIGDARIGVAVSDLLGITAQPVGVIQRKGWGPDICQIAEYATQYGTQTILSGLPRNMDGTEGFQTQKIREFTDQLQKAGFTVLFQDERLTTVSAEHSLIESGLSRKERKGVVDCTAAILILQSYLDAHTQKKEKKAMNEENENIVELIGEDGEPVQFEHLMTLEYEGKKYPLLTPVSPEDPNEEGMVVIMRIDNDENGEECYVVEEDDDVCDKVFNRFLELMDEEDDEE